MKLETEFRIRLQLMQLEQVWDNILFDDCSYPCHDGALSTSDRGSRVAKIQPLCDPPPSTWVKLIQAPGLLSSDEALLLCPVSVDQWIAWVPDHGEIVLEREEFYLDWDGME